MSFEFRTLCGVEPDRPAHRVAAVLMPLGAAASLLPWTPPWAALLAGAALALTLGNPCVVASARLAKWLLQLAVVGLGAGVNLAIVARVGLHGLGYTFAGLVVTFALGAWLAGRLRVAPKVAALVCAGTGICGGSAIAAAAPAIGARVEETSVSMAVVFLLNGVALLIFPPLGTWAGLDPHAFGLWCALAIHDTSSVTGAAMTHGHLALVTATTVKLARALWIIPVALALGAWSRRGSGEAATGQRPAIPWFIGGFIAVSALFTLVPALQPLVHPVALGSRALLTLTLFFIGSGLSRAVLRVVGIRPLVHAVLLWIVIGSTTLLAIRTGLIR